MKITLIIKTEINKETGEEKVIESKTFNSIRPRGRAFQRTLKIADIIQKAGENFNDSHYELMCEYICTAFGDQFTVDELLDGMYQEDIFPTFEETLKNVTKRVENKMLNVAKN